MFIILIWPSLITPSSAHVFSATYTAMTFTWSAVKINICATFVSVSSRVLIVSHRSFLRGRKNENIISTQSCTLSVYHLPVTISFTRSLML